MKFNFVNNLLAAYIRESQLPGTAEKRGGRKLQLHTSDVEKPHNLIQPTQNKTMAFLGL